MRQLTSQELEQYRQHIADLDMEAHEVGHTLNDISEFESRRLSPHSPIGHQVYESYSKEELLDIFLKALDAPDHKLNYRNIYIIYRRYLNQRFGDEATAKIKARTLVKQRKEESRWPADWPERVSVEPLLAELERRKKHVSAEDMHLLSQLCKTAKETGIPPVLCQDDEAQLQKLLYSKKALELMGIPYLNKAALKHMQKYWKSERQKQSQVS